MLDIFLFLNLNLVIPSLLSLAGVYPFNPAVPLPSAPFLRPWPEQDGEGERRCSICECGVLNPRDEVTVREHGPRVLQLLGGLASNEILKAVSGKGEPVNNCVFYALAGGGARVMQLG